MYSLYPGSRLGPVFTVVHFAIDQSSHKGALWIAESLLINFTVGTVVHRRVSLLTAGKHQRTAFSSQHMCVPFTAGTAPSPQQQKPIQRTLLQLTARFSSPPINSSPPPLHSSPSPRVRSTSRICSTFTASTQTALIQTCANLEAARSAGRELFWALIAAGSPVCRHDFFLSP